MSLDPQLSLWLDAFAAAFKDSSLIKITVSKPMAQPNATQDHSDHTDLKSVDVRPVLIKREMKLSFTYHHKTRDIVKNYGLPEAETMLSQFLSGLFTGARLYSATADTGLARRGGAFHLETSKPSLKPSDAAHNRAKNHLISGGGKSYLQALGLTDQQGQVLKTAQDKFRQINKYIEIIDGLIKHLPPRKLRIVDMGAGKGYLTFALYDHLANTLKMECDITGVEFRADLVKLCNQIAKDSHFSGLNFVEGTIAGYDCSGADMVIALHACDTATDDAIAKAIAAKAGIIVVAPCCHKQIRREMKASGSTSDKTGDLDFLLRFGTYQERFSEMVTDGLRAQLMELSGYEAKLFEFISDAHTPKNVMIVGQKLAAPRSEAARLKIANSIAETKQRFGIGMHQLELLLKQ